MNALIKIVLSCFSLLITTAVVAGDVPVTISGKIVNTNGQPVSGVRMMVVGSAFSRPSFSVPGGVGGGLSGGFGGLIAATKSRVFPAVPDACLSTESSFPVITNSRGEYTVRLTFKPDLAVTIPGEGAKNCSTYRRDLTRSGMVIKPHPDDVTRYKLELAYGPLPKIIQIKNPAALQEMQENRPLGGFAPRHLQ